MAKVYFLILIDIAEFSCIDVLQFDSPTCLSAVLEQGGAQGGSQWWVHETQFILVSSFVSYCVVFHSNICKPTLPHPVLFSTNFFLFPIW